MLLIPTYSVSFHNGFALLYYHLFVRTSFLISHNLNRLRLAFCLLFHCAALPFLIFLSFLLPMFLPFASLSILYSCPPSFFYYSPLPIPYHSSSLLFLFSFIALVVVFPVCLIIWTILLYIFFLPYYCQTFLLPVVFLFSFFLLHAFILLSPTFSFPLSSFLSLSLLYFLFFSYFSILFLLLFSFSFSSLWIPAASYYLILVFLYISSFLLFFLSCLIFSCLWLSYLLATSLPVSCHASFVRFISSPLFSTLYSFIVLPFCHYFSLFSS